jgi:hypothetical protein
MSKLVEIMWRICYWGTGMRNAAHFEHRRSVSGARNVTYRRVMVMSLVALVVPLSLCEASEYNSPYSPEFVYVSIFRTVVNIGGSTFDGTSFFTGGQDVIVCPDIGNGYGYAIHLGVRPEDYIGVEVLYYRANHESTWSDLSFNASSRSYGLSFMLFGRARHRLQTFGRFGLCLDVIHVEDGSYDAANDRIGDASFKAIAIPLGLGLRCYLHPSLSLLIEGSYVVRSVTAMKGIVDREYVKPEDGSFYAGGFTLKAGLAVGFGRK